jgi:hypothetical protein
MATSVSEPRGPRLTDEDYDALHEVYLHGPLTLQADYVRNHSTQFATLASMGLITNLLPDGTVSRQWRLTPLGQWHVHN